MKCESCNIEDATEYAISYPRPATRNEAAIMTQPLTGDKLLRVCPKCQNKLRFHNPITGQVEHE